MEILNVILARVMYILVIANFAEVVEEYSAPNVMAKVNCLV
jgi:hypothetical protein